MEEDEEDVGKADISDVVVQHVIVRPTGKVAIRRLGDWEQKTFSFSSGAQTISSELYGVVGRDKLKSKTEVPELQQDSGCRAARTPNRHPRLVHQLGRQDAGICGQQVALKIWNIKTLDLHSDIRVWLRALCCAFLPGDKVVVVGTKERRTPTLRCCVCRPAGKRSMRTKEAPSGLCRSTQTGKSVVSGSADKSAKF